MIGETGHVRDLTDSVTAGLNQIASPVESSPQDVLLASDAGSRLEEHVKAALAKIHRTGERRNMDRILDPSVDKMSDAVQVGGTEASDHPL